MKYYALLNNYQYGAFPFRSFHKNIFKEAKLDRNHRIVLVNLEKKEANFINNGITGNANGETFRKYCYSDEGIIIMQTQIFNNIKERLVK